MPRANEWLAQGFVTVLALCATPARFLPRWLREDWHTADLSQHVWWTARFADPALFPGDFIADFFSLPLFAPPGHQALYRVGVRFADPQTVAESLPFVLGPLLVWLCWRLGRAAGGGSLAGAVVGGCAGIQLMAYLDAGLPRGFALPLLALALLGLLERRLLWLGIAGLGAALFYPPIAINLGLTAGLVLGVEAVRSRRMPEGWRALAVLGGVALLVVLRSYAAGLPEDVGPRVSRAQAQAMAEFGPDGRSAFFEESFVDTFFGNGRGGYGLRLHQSAALAAAVALSARWLPGTVPFTAWALLGTALMAHALAHLVLFALHLPARYVSYALPLFAVLWLSSLAPRLAAGVRARLPFLGSASVLAAAALLILAVNAHRSLASAREQLSRPVSLPKEETMAFLASLPEDTLIASHPEDANSIPLRTRRSVLASKEVALPYYLGYYARLSERLEDSLRAVYGRDWADVEILHERYGVDVLALNQRRLGPDLRRFDAPFGERLAGLWRAQPEPYALFDPPADRVLFLSGQWRVVRLGPPRPGYEASGDVRPATAKNPAAAGTR